MTTISLTAGQMDARFRNRRRMAWTALAALLAKSFGFTLIALFWPSTTEVFDAMRWLITAAIGAEIAIVYAYYGVAAYEQGRMK